MKYLPLVWAGLWRKPTRTLFTFLSIIVAFLLLGVLAGVNLGFTHLIDEARADRLFVDRRYGAMMPMAYQDQIKAIPGVTAVAGVIQLSGYFQERQNSVGFSGAKADFFALRPEILVKPEHIKMLEENRTGAVITDSYARKFGMKVGDRVPIQSMTAQKNGSKVWTFDILAVIPDDNNPQKARHFFVNYDYLDEVKAVDPGTIGRYTVNIADPDRATEIGLTIDRIFANSPSATYTTSEKAGMQAGLHELGDTNFLLKAVGGAVLFMMLFLTGNSAMQSVRERIPEFGVMKVLGFTDLGVLATVLAESTLCFVTASCIGLAFSKVLIGIVNGLPNSPSALLVPWVAVAVGVGLSVFVGVVSALIPAWRVKRLSPIDALAGR